MEVMKFGGAVLKSKLGFESMARIIKRNTKYPLLIVISAFSDATRRLSKAAHIAESGDEMPALRELKSVLKENIKYAEDLIRSRNSIKELVKEFDSKVKLISDYFKGIAITKELTPRTLDAVLSLGEFFALHIVDKYLKEQGIEAECIDASEFIVSDINYGNAKPMVRETEEKLAVRVIPVLNSKGIVLTQGFVAANRAGETTTMGIESSNLTASLLASLLGCQKLTLWTDVPGFRSADPKLADNTKSISTLDYSEAYELARHGLKLVYPDMISFARDKGIEIIYRSGLDPDGDFTVINNIKAEKKSPIVVLKEDLTFLYIKSIDRKGKDVSGELRNIFREMLDNLFIYKEGNGEFRIIGPANELRQVQMPDQCKYNKIQDICCISVINPEHTEIKKICRLIIDYYAEEIVFYEADFNNSGIKIAINKDKAPSLVRLLHDCIYN